MDRKEFLKNILSIGFGSTFFKFFNVADSKRITTKGLNMKVSDSSYQEPGVNFVIPLIKTIRTGVPGKITFCQKP